MRAAECLESISKEQGKDANLLYACVLEAQKNGDRLQVIRALSQVLEKTTYQAAAGLHLPALLRYVAEVSIRFCTDLCSLTARMLIQELESGQSQDQQCIDELCKVFEGGMLSYHIQTILSLFFRGF